MGRDVHLRSSALDRIARDLASEGKRRQEGEEIGGLLLGSRGGGWGRNSIRILSVDTYCSTVLHQVLGSVKNRIAEQRKLSGFSEGRQQTTVLGYYRIAWEGRLSLSESDTALISEEFSEPESICLLIRDSKWTTPPAKFFYWQEKNLNSADIDFPRISEISADEGQRSERHAPAPNWRLSKAAITTVAVALALALVLAIFIEVLLKHQNFHARASAKATSAAPASRLEFAATQEGTAVRLTWNGRSAEIRNAQSGVLSVNDGRREKEIPLLPAQLKEASFWYFPLSGNLRFRLDITLEDGRRTGETSGLILLKSQPGLSSGEQVTRTSADERGRARSH